MRARPTNTVQGRWAILFEPYDQFIMKAAIHASELAVKTMHLMYRFGSRNVGRAALCPTGEFHYDQQPHHAPWPSCVRDRSCGDRSDGPGIAGACKRSCGRRLQCAGGPTTISQALRSWTVLAAAGSGCQAPFAAPAMGCRSRASVSRFGRIRPKVMSATPHSHGATLTDENGNFRLEMPQIVPAFGQPARPPRI